MQAAACAECAAAKDHLRPIKIEIQKAYVIACGITGSVKPIPVFIIADDGTILEQSWLFYIQTSLWLHLIWTACSMIDPPCLYNGLLF